MKQPARQVVYRPVSELNKLDGNPRVIKDKAFKALCKSVKQNPDYFEARPIILSDRTGDLVIIAGNQRYEAAVHNKLTEVPTILLDGLSEEREREIIIRDNVNNGEWDFDELANNWDFDELVGWGIDFDFAPKKTATPPGPGAQSDSSKKASYLVLVECATPGDQADTYARLCALGLTCSIAE